MRLRLLLATTLLLGCGAKVEAPPPCQVGATRCGANLPGAEGFTEKCTDPGPGLGWYPWNTCSLPLGCVTCSSSLAVCGSTATSCP